MEAANGKIELPRNTNAAYTDSIICIMAYGARTLTVKEILKKTCVSSKITSLEIKTLVL